MRKLLKPDFDVGDIVADCVSNMRTDQDKYLCAIPVIERASEEYEEAMVQTQAHKISVHENVTHNVSKDDMVSLYTNKFAKKEQPGRRYYDRIKIAPVNGVCPLCGIGQVATLDHYMAKTLYPTLAVTPSNLIPACRDCNEPRGSVRIVNSSDMTLHPYFDEVQDFEWLTATVVSTHPICVKYEVSDSLQDTELRSRLEQHLIVFDLAERFAKKAAEEITAHRLTFQTLLNVGGIDGLRGYLQMLYENSYATEINSWRTALYKALTDVEKIVVDGEIAV